MRAITTRSFDFLFKYTREQGGPEAWPTGKFRFSEESGGSFRMNIMRQVRDSQFLRHNAVFFLASIVVGGLNYLYYPVLGRMLPPEPFGEVQTLVSLFLQLGVFLTVLSMVVVTIVANYDDEAKRSRFVFEFEKLALLVGAGLLLASVVFRSQLQAWLQFESSWPFVVLAAAVVASVPFTLRGAYLRGRQKFGFVSAGNIALAGGKLIISAALVALGLGTIGAMWGVLAAQLVACALVGWWAYRLGLRGMTEGKRFSLPDRKLLGPELRYGGVVLVCSLAITLQYSIDIVIMKHYFDATTAGLYAGVSAVARILFFATASVAQVMISKVTLQAGERTNQQVLYKSLVLLCAISIPILLVLALFPSQIVGVLMGRSYEAMAQLLPKLSLSVFIVSVVNILATYYLALRRLGVAWAVAAGAGLTYLFILLHHGSPSAVVDSLLLGSAITLAAVGVWKVTERRCGA
jgi:O-antigen/teichoic acid export membrane protein